MRRVFRLLLALVAAAVATVGTLPGGRLQSATPEAALTVDGSNPACSDAQARVLDPAHPYCSVARAAAVITAGDTVRIAPGRYAGTVRPARGGTSDAPSGDNLGIAADFAGQPRPATGPVDIGAYNATPLTG